VAQKPQLQSVGQHQSNCIVYEWEMSEWGRWERESS